MKEDHLAMLYKDKSTPLVDRYYELYPWENSLKFARLAAKGVGDVKSFLTNMMGEEYWENKKLEDITCVSRLRVAELKYNKCYVKNALYLLFGFIGY